MTELVGAGTIEVYAEDRANLEVLYAELRGKAGITAELVSAHPEPGDQGALLEMLTVGLTSGAVTAFFQVIKALVESRGPGFVLMIQDRRKKHKVKITVRDGDAGLAALKELLDGS